MHTNHTHMSASTTPMIHIQRLHQHRITDTTPSDPLPTPTPMSDQLDVIHPNTRLLVYTQLNFLPLTKIFTWNLNRQSSYDRPINVCLHGHIDLLHCIEPSTFMSIKGSPVSSTLIRTTDKVEYIYYITALSHTSIRQTILLARLDTRRSSDDGRLHTFIFKDDNGDHIAVLGMYAFQRGHNTHGTSTPTTHGNPRTKCLN